MLSGAVSFHSGVHTCVSLPIRGVRPGVHQLILYEAGHTAVNPFCKESVDTSQLPPWRSGFCFGMPARPIAVNTVTTDGKGSVLCSVSPRWSGRLLNIDFGMRKVTHMRWSEFGCSFFFFCVCAVASIQYLRKGPFLMGHELIEPATQAPGVEK